jgi:tetratricopeptide (TPR) repeat protein
VDPLFKEHILLQPVLAALQAKPTHSEDFRKAAIRLAKAQGNPSASDLNEIAWPLVDPDRQDKNTDTALALRCIQAAVERKPNNWMYQDTLAWALFENGLHAEAIAASERALDHAPEDEKTEYQGYLDRLNRMIAELKDD